jgi:hypothetical protein
MGDCKNLARRFGEFVVVAGRQEEFLQGINVEHNAHESSGLRCAQR